MDPASELVARGGAAFLRDLRAAGVRRAAIEAAVASGEIERLRPGLVIIRGLDDDIRRAARVGGRLAGMSAARHHGMWSQTDRIEVAVPRHTGRLWDPRVPREPLREDGAHILRDERLDGLARPRFGVSAPLTALAEVTLTNSPAMTIAVADSLFRVGPFHEIDVHTVEAALPPRARGALPRFDRRSESGTESILRVLLQDAGLDPVPQAPLPIRNLSRADLLIGDRLVIECDSDAHHGSPDQRRDDRSRDLSLAAFGYLGLRADYRQVMDEPTRVVDAVLRYVQLGLDRFDPARDRIRPSRLF